MTQATASTGLNLPADPAQPLTVEEAAAWLRVGVNAVYSALREGGLKGVKVGKQWRVTRQAIQSYLGGGVRGSSALLAQTDFIEGVKDLNAVKYNH